MSPNKKAVIFSIIYIIIVAIMVYFGNKKFEESEAEKLTLKTQYDEVSDKFYTLKEENDNLKQEIKKQGLIASSDYNGVLEELQSIKQECKIGQATIDTLKDRINVLVNEKENLTEQLNQSKEKYDKLLNGDMEAYIDKINNLLATVNQQNKEIEDLKEKNEQQTTEYTTKLQSLRQTREIKNGNDVPTLIEMLNNKLVEEHEQK